MVFINYMSGANLEYTARVAVNDRSTVRVRYLLAESITSKFNITYASQHVNTSIFFVFSMLTTCLLYSGAAISSPTACCAAIRRLRPYSAKPGHVL